MAVTPVEYLVVAPHPDDAELGMGGTIAKLIRTGKAVAVCDLTSGEPTPSGSPAKRRKEMRAASEVLGLVRRVNLNLKNRALEATLAARYWGSMIGRAYGEPFTVQETLGLADLDRII
jgi:LmbE family N-acetylglucosaminyl deacetylase